MTPSDAEFGPGLDASPTRMPANPACQRTRSKEHRKCEGLKKRQRKQIEETDGRCGHQGRNLFPQNHVRHWSQGCTSLNNSVGAAPRRKPRASLRGHNMTTVQKTVKKVKHKSNRGTSFLNLPLVVEDAGVHRGLNDRVME